MSARLERQRRRRRRGGAARIIILTLAVFTAGGVIAVLSAVGYVVGIANSAPSLGSLKPQDPGRLSTVLAADGTRLGTIRNDVLRERISSKQIPQSMKDATVAIEDRRFYEHKGVDFEGVVRAAFKNATSGKTLEGGSTLTMQLIRTLYPGLKERTFKRKVHEAKLAEQLENVHSGRSGKAWILAKYLNSAPYGTNGGLSAIGVQAAAQVYFDKSASELTLPESALIAGLPQAPSEYNPFRAPDAAIARRNKVLTNMADVGFITRQAAQEAIATPLQLHKNQYFRQKREQYFFDYVTDQLLKRYKADEVKNGGLTIKTTIDLDLQEKARKSIAEDLSFDGAPSSAIVTIDPSNGYIRTMASSTKYTDSKFNIAADGERQPGSTFKVMTLAAAVREGINPATTFYPSGPVALGPQYDNVVIQCYGGKCAGGTPSLVTATLRSDNTVFVRLAQDLGFKKVAKAAHDLGIESKVDANPSGTLGGLTKCCTPLEMANAYATVASGGWRNTPKAITSVKFPDGKVDDLSKPERVKAFDSAAMFEVTKILEQNIKSGTGTRANFGCPAGGKTGTTSDNADAWFAGYTPKLATAVWVGFPQGKVPMGNLFNGGPVDGGTFPAQIWGRYMKQAERGFCGAFKKPGDAFKPKAFKGKNSLSAPPDAGSADPSVDPQTGKAREKTKTTADPQAPDKQAPSNPGGAAPKPNPTPKPSRKPSASTGGTTIDPDINSPDPGPPPLDDVP